MTEILDNLNREEYSIINLIKELVGTIDGIENQLIEMDIPRKYRNIYNSYCNYHRESGNGEAFKRIIFIQWYGASEPLAFSGIGELDTKFQSDNLKILADLVQTKSIDEEFKSMILHYYSVSDWYFDSHSDFSKYIGHISKHHSTINFEVPFNNRGQMGEYWNTIELEKRHRGVL